MPPYFDIPLLLELPVPEEELLPEPMLGLVLPEVLLPEVPRLGVPVLLPLRDASTRSAATQSSNAVPVMPTQRERSEDDAEGPLSEVPDAEDELGDDGLVALGEVALPVELGPADPDTDEPGLAELELPELPVCASTTLLASALAARTASAFKGKCFIKSSP